MKPAASTASQIPDNSAPAAPSGLLGTSCEIAGRFLDVRKEDFHRQNTAQKLLKGVMNKRGKPYRTVHCTRTVKSREAGVNVLLGKTSGKAKFSGLQTCGSVWNCRPCQKKITRLRQAEIQSAMSQHFGNGGTCYMLTFTHGHHAHDDLLLMVERYADAMSYMTSHRAYKALMADFCFGGRVRALETTFGWSNGFHPHGHELHFRDGKKLSKARMKELQMRLYPLWRDACVKFGLAAPSEKHGVDVSAAWSAAEYMAKFGSDQKWGAGKELTRLNSKKSTDDERFTPFDLLRAYEQGYKPEVMCTLFREYARAYYGRRQLHWSGGLKARFDIDEVEDDEAVQLVEEEHALAGNIGYQDWRRVIRQSRDRRVEVLETCEKGGFVAVATFIATLEEVPQPTVAEEADEPKSSKRQPRRQPEYTDPDTNESPHWAQYARPPQSITPHFQHTIVYLGCSDEYLRP